MRDCRGQGREGGVHCHRKTVQAGGVVRIDALRHFGIGDHLGVAPHVAVEGHVLNEAYVEGRLPRQLHEVQQLVIILPPHHHHVHLYVHRKADAEICRGWSANQHWNSPIGWVTRRDICSCQGKDYCASLFHPKCLR